VIDKEGRDGLTHLYADAAGEYLAFKVTEDRLVTRLAAAEVVRDMVSVAQHRGWEAIEARGSVDFRRGAWLEASLRDIKVQGYEPTELDRQTLSDRKNASGRSSGHVEDRVTVKLDYDKGVSGRLVEVGRAPYRDRANAETSSYAAIELDDGRKHKIWGVDLEKAIADSKARQGDHIHVRRNGIERVAKDIKVIDAASGRANIERREVTRNRWRVTAEQFRTADRKAAAADADLVAAESQVIAIEKALQRVLDRDSSARQRIIQSARERIAEHIGRGYSFARATIDQPVHEHHRLETATDKSDSMHEGDRFRVREKQR
jgi:hypothetical protein